MNAKGIKTIIMLTDIQKTFLLNSFFANQFFPGWRNVAIKLIDEGRCIVAGSNSIWHGGVGNFIQTSVARDAYECTLLTFDVEKFLLWGDVQDKLHDTIVMRRSKLEELTKELEELQNLKQRP